MQEIKDKIRNIKDFPKKGIVFRDITTAVKDAKALKFMVDFLTEQYEGKNIDYVAGVESRGFIFGSALAYNLGAGFIMIRKPGKLPANVVSQEYALEYGTDKIEMHADAIEEGKNVLVIDDLLATGGTVEAACKLLRKVGANVVGAAFIIELSDLKGREKLKDIDVVSMIQYEGL
jgi:adenine phosphoribosyltransferase